MAALRGPPYLPRLARNARKCEISVLWTLRARTYVLLGECSLWYSECSLTSKITQHARFHHHDRAGAPASPGGVGPAPDERRRAAPAADRNGAPSVCDQRF